MKRYDYDLLSKRINEEMKKVLENCHIGGALW